MKDHVFNRRAFLKAAVALGAAGALPRCVAKGATGRAGRPNVVLIMADDLGYECLGANGGTSYATPVLDALARTGVRFEHCYSQPLCTPSRVKLMTGLSNVRNYVRFGLLERSQKTFAHLFKEAGYATCIAGKWQLGKEPDSPRHFGFDESCLWQHTRGRIDGEKHDTRYPNPRLEINGQPVNYEKGEYGPGVASDFLCDFMDRHQAEPFLVYYPMILTHCPFCASPDSTDWDPADKGTTIYKGQPKYFGDMVTYMDKMVGKITAKLDALGLTENTLVLFTGDNGTDKPIVSMMNGRPVAGGKGSMTDAGTRVPLIAHWPGVVRAGRTCNDLVDFSDVLPTICQAAGVTIPATPRLDGRSFLPQLKGQRGNPRDWIYCWYSRNGKLPAQEWARTQRYKLYRTGRFFDITGDPLEKTPLAAEGLADSVKATRAMLQGALDTFAGARSTAIP